MWLNKCLLFELRGCLETNTPARIELSSESFAASDLLQYTEHDSERPPDLLQARHENEDLTIIKYIRPEQQSAPFKKPCILFRQPTHVPKILVIYLHYSAECK